MSATDLTSTREVDPEFGDVFYIIRDGGREIARAYKMCGNGYQLEVAGEDGYYRVPSIKAAKERIMFRAELLARPAV